MGLQEAGQIIKTGDTSLASQLEAGGYKSIQDHAAWVIAVSSSGLMWQQFWYSLQWTHTCIYVGRQACYLVSNCENSWHTKSDLRSRPISSQTPISFAVALVSMYFRLNLWGVAVLRNPIKGPRLLICSQQPPLAVQEYAQCQDLCNESLYLPKLVLLYNESDFRKGTVSVSWCLLSNTELVEWNNVSTTI
jgi:hypothetical protein